MDMRRQNVLLMIPVEEWEAFVQGQKRILDRLDQISQSKPPANSISARYLTAIEFMNAVHIRRSKFDQLVAGNKIRTIKKKRKIYVPIGEVERFFADSSIQ